MRLVFAALALGVGASAHAQEFPEPTWPELLSGSELVVRGRVVEGSPWASRVEVEHVYAGSAPEGPLTVVGLTDPFWPPPVVRIETPSPGQTVWLFLEPLTPERVERYPIRPTPWSLAGVETPEGRTFLPVSPMTGDFAELPDGVGVRLLVTGGGHHNRQMPRETFETFLEQALAIHRDGRDPAEALRATRPCLDTPPASAPPRRPDWETDGVRCLASLAIFGENRWDERIAGFARSASPAERAAAGQVAATIPVDPALGVVIALLLDPEPIVRGVVAAAVPDARRGAVADEALRLLRATREAEPPADLPVPVERLREPPVRALLVELVGHFGDDAQVDGLVAEVPTLNPPQVFPAVIALERLRPGSWIEPFEELGSQLGRERTRAVLEAAHAVAQRASHPWLERVAFDADVEPWLQRVALHALEVTGDADTAARVRARLVRRLQRMDAFHPDDVDMISAELELLRALQGPEAVDMAWELASTYLGQPRETGDVAFAQHFDARRASLARKARQVLPADSTVDVRLHGVRSLEDEGLLVVDVDVPEGLARSQQQAVADAVGTEPARVRLCGRRKGRRTCIEDKVQAWRMHQAIVLPLVRIVALASGQSDEVSGETDALARPWLDRLHALGLFEQTGADATWADIQAWRYRQTHEPPPPPPLPDIPEDVPLPRNP